VLKGCQDGEGIGCGGEGVIEEWMLCRGPVQGMVPDQCIRFPKSDVGWCVVV